MNGPFDFSTSGGILDFIGFLIKLGLIVEPTLVGIYNDWKNGKITAEEADAAAGGKFSAMATALTNPHGDAQALNAAEDAKLNEKFPAK